MVSLLQCKYHSKGLNVKWSLFIPEYENKYALNAEFYEIASNFYNPKNLKNENK